MCILEGVQKPNIGTTDLAHTLVSSLQTHVSQHHAVSCSYMYHDVTETSRSLKIIGAYWTCNLTELYIGTTYLAHTLVSSLKTHVSQHHAVSCSYMYHDVTETSRSLKIIGAYWTCNLTELYIGTTDLAHTLVSSLQTHVSQHHAVSCSYMYHDVTETSRSLKIIGAYWTCHLTQLYIGTTDLAHTLVSSLQTHPVTENNPSLLDLSFDTTIYWHDRLAHTLVSSLQTHVSQHHAVSCSCMYHDVTETSWSLKIIGALDLSFDTAIYWHDRPGTYTGLFITNTRESTSCSILLPVTENNRSLLDLSFDTAIYWHNRPGTYTGLFITNTRESTSCSILLPVTENNRSLLDLSFDRAIYWHNRPGTYTGLFITNTRERRPYGILLGTTSQSHVSLDEGKASSEPVKLGNKPHQLQQSSPHDVPLLDIYKVSQIEVTHRFLLCPVVCSTGRYKPARTDPRWVIGGWERHKDRVTDIVYAAATPVTCRTTFSLYQLLLKY
ncbi:hypothetical protein J6590_085472 [Homalodisca vitripennis]|nr:hypothetical protein J6590_085472 [Homalodisca vitripennis]